jgi:hypothetical protein
MALTGAELKALAAEMRTKDATEDAVAIKAGYVNDKTGKPKLAQFRVALNEALGLSFAKPAKRSGRAGKPLSYSVTIGKAGSIMLAGGYSRLIGAEPGGSLVIAQEGNSLVLKPAVAAPSGQVTPF